MQGMTKSSNAQPPDRVRLATGAETPDHVREELVAAVKRKLESGELDSEIARVETALALLDGDA